jgi:ABC-type nickel/cobalt efflux system permease component RcnA
MMDTSLGAALGLGFLLGLRHALDADHIAAVSALVSQHRSVARSCLLGTFWGAGHTVALLGAAVAVIAFRLTISPGVERGLELAVALLLILLGGHVLLKALGGWALHGHEHSHDSFAHSHLHLHGAAHGPSDGAHEHLHLIRLGGRPFLVGLLHGMAGSAALMLLVLTTLPSPLAGFLYVLVFGVGSTAGMLVLSGLIGIPFAVSAQRSREVQALIQGLAGATSLLLGVMLAWEMGSL